MLTSLVRKQPMKILFSVATLAAVLLLSACAAKPPVPTTQAADLKSPRPGFVPGYLPVKSLVDSLALLPPPPRAGSSAQKADDDAYLAALAAKDSPRWALAAGDAELRFPQAADAFACALGMTVRVETPPHLTMLLRRSLADAGLATYAAKDKHQRPRPFMVHNGAMCTPAQDAALRKDGAYPSGHAALGWAWGLVLTEVAPDRTNALAQRARDFAQSRVACGVHWQSDVDAGRDVAAVVVAQLHSDATFRTQLALAQQEYRAAQANPRAQRPAATDCQAEAAALGR